MFNIKIPRFFENPNKVTTLTDDDSILVEQPHNKGYSKFGSGAIATLSALKNYIGTSFTAIGTSFTPTGTIAATNVQAMGQELDNDIQTHISDTTTHGTTGDIVGTSDTQTLTNKTLTSPVINSPTGIVKADVGLGNVTNESKATMFTNSNLTGTTTAEFMEAGSTIHSSGWTTNITIDDFITVGYNKFFILEPTAPMDIEFNDVNGREGAYFEICNLGTANISFTTTYGGAGLLTIINSGVILAQNEVCVVRCIGYSSTGFGLATWIIYKYTV